MMNDPQIVALTYLIELGEAFDYSKAGPSPGMNQDFG